MTSYLVDFKHICLIICLTLISMGAVNASTTDGAWLIENQLTDEVGNQIVTGDKRIVFFDEVNGLLYQNSREAAPGSVLEQVTFNQQSETSYRLPSALPVYVYATIRVFQQLTLDFVSSTVELSGAAKLGRRVFTYNGTGVKITPQTLNIENEIATVADLSFKRSGIPLIYSVQVDSQQTLKVHTKDIAEPGSRNSGAKRSVRLTVVRGHNVFTERSIDGSKFEQEVVVTEPESGEWLIMLDSETSFDQVDLVVELGDNVIVVNPTDPVDPTDPTDPVDPTNPSTPSDPSDPNAPSDPANPTDPIDQPNPADPTDPADIEIIKPHVGWWWNPAESGRGFSVEFQDEKDEKGVGQNNAVFFGAYLYNEVGIPVWHTTLLEPVENAPNQYEGDLLDFRNGSTLLSSRYFQPRLVGDSGKVIITVTDESHIELDWPGDNSVIEPFIFSTDNGQQDLEDGWWWNPFTPGQGYFMEQQGDVVYFVSYLYNESGDAVWYAAFLTSTQSGKKSVAEYTGQLVSYADGQTLTGGYKAPLPPETIGFVTIVFQSDNSAVIDWPGGKQALQRFYFRK